MRFSKITVSLVAFLALAGSALTCSFWLASAPAFAQAQPISIFFDFAQSDLGPAGKKILAEVVKYDIKPGARVRIVGHCDTAEPDPDKLSLARARVVEKAFRDLGLPAGAQITVTGRGATQLREKTGPKVREPLNRYVAITIN
ncbi:MAG TPA: OmpA family protein [Xanthobacteraceae bacterium]|jgi:outer membrane protein OmpA-like peptidoglycan-associated protein